MNRREGQLAALESAQWHKHVFKEGSREHAPSFGLLEVIGVMLPVTWCSSPFCSSNQAMAEWLLSKGAAPVVAQPPPRLRQLLENAND